MTAPCSLACFVPLIVPLALSGVLLVVGGLMCGVAWLEWGIRRRQRRVETWGP